MSLSPTQSGLPEGVESASNVYSIPPGVPFLKTLAEAIVSGQFGTGFDNNPYWLADSIVFLPTRRAARSLGIELLEAAQKYNGASAVLLPRIRTIGDLEEEEGLFGLEQETAEMLGALPDSRTVIDPAMRQLILARLAQRWVETMTPATKALLQEEHIILPSSASDALYLASDLARFMDQIEAEEGDWNDIKSVTPDDYGQWWQLTLNFLDIVMGAWPEIMQQNGSLNPSQFRNKIIDFRISELDRSPPKGLVIAAGTTGSIPATARLLGKIKSMAQGRIVLPGLDLNLPKNVIDRFHDSGEMNGETVASTHPQFGMVNLLQKLKTRHDDVKSLGQPDQTSCDRETILNTVLLPAEDSKQWVATRTLLSDQIVEKSLNDVTLIEAPGEYEEALSIALVLQEALCEPNKTAALVTPDRGLAQRVSSELERFDIEIDDSAGNPLLTSKPALFLRQILHCAFYKDDPVVLSSLLKNGLMRLSNENDLSHSLELLELALVRDAIILPAIDQLSETLELRRKEIVKSTYAPPVLKKLPEEDWQFLARLARAISEGLRELCELATNNTHLTPDVLISATKRAGEQLSMNQAGATTLYEAAGGTELQGFMETYSADQATGFQFAAFESVAVFDALLARKRTRKTGRTRPRLHLYGNLEARLQNADLIILAGLNEGVWPQSTNNDPYLNRPMRAALHLPLPERRIGLAAHDFVQFSGIKEVFYTRSLRVDDTPTIASRWLQRLKTFIGEAETERMTKRGEKYLNLANLLEAPTQAPNDIRPPSPCPPVSARPKSLSITEIETWIRDPYAIYAKHILGLYALPPLVREADPALRGSIYHAILARFTDEWKGMIDDKSRETFFKIADSVFAAQNLPPEILAEWRPRFEPIGNAFLEWENKRYEFIKYSHCEIELKAEIGDTGFVLRGRADRIDEHGDGTLSVIDYKTGSHPSKKQARTFSPQLSLEAALAMKGEIPGIAAQPLKQMLYVRLKPGDAFSADDISKSQDKKQPVLSSDELAELAYGELTEHIIAYQQPRQAYVSQYVPIPNKNYAGDYDHLARIREWSIGSEEDGGIEE